MKNNPYIKRNNDQINKENFNRKKTMVWCPEKKEFVSERCVECIFYYPEKINPCNYDNWFPGLKKGKEWK